MSVRNNSGIFIITQTLYRCFQHLCLDYMKTLLNLVFILEYDAKIIMKAHSFAKIRFVKSLLQPFLLNFGKSCPFLQLLRRHLMSDCLSDLIHCDQIFHTPVPGDDRIRIRCIKSGTKRFFLCISPLFDISSRFIIYYSVQIKRGIYPVLNVICFRIKIGFP